MSNIDEWFDRQLGVACASIPSASDINDMSYETADALHAAMTPKLHALIACWKRVAHRVVVSADHQGEALQHIAQRSGASRAATSADFWLVEALCDLPEVAAKVTSGALCLEKARIIADAAQGDAALADELLGHADAASVTGLAHRATALRLRGCDARQRRHQQRKEQYFSVRHNGDYVVIAGRLLPEYAPWLGALQELKRTLVGSDDPEGLGTAARFAEACATRLGNGFFHSRHTRERPELCFHVDVCAVDGDQVRFDPVATSPGLGPVPLASLSRYFDDVAVSIVGKTNGQAKWFSSYGALSLPDRTKRAISRAQRGVCAMPTCDAPVAQIDHRLAQMHGGSHDADNLQGLCVSCHTAKTFVDVPFAQRRYYERSRDGEASRDEEVRRESG